MLSLLVFSALGAGVVIILSWIKTWKKVDEIHEKLREDLNEWF
jgi:hypothetical protein